MYILCELHVVLISTIDNDCFVHKQVLENLSQFNRIIEGWGEDPLSFANRWAEDISFESSEEELI